MDSPASVLRHTVQTLGEDGWFGFKAGGDAIAIAERSGLVDAYLRELRFILLRRRDLVAQAVSIVKAKVTGRFHSTQTEKRPAEPSDYSRSEILRKMRIILNGVRRLDAYARGAGRPFRIAFYEDFENGDFAAIESLCDALGLPRRAEIAPEARRAVERIGDHVNAQWCERFRAEADGEARRLLKQYAKLL